ncbi:hypothetical protein AMJ83_09440 [candidate division WOR_3 bacterium SM23_42]|uniref:Glycosyl hydrolase-like 10 domain-containing protein n=1 Tax=candidate division WOR_3 bacterium SM23_42 TaxID=1703779 RepID=A0A0S8FRY6_UNCW3|nr:MAG: hypothetical protein AMJ83_09440 [candidate division WOR_3 bacterium SM23_42]
MPILTLLLVCSLDVRGIWIPRWSIDDHHTVFTRLEGEFNHVFLQIFALGEAYYPSGYAPTKIRDDAWLNAFLDEAHRRGIKVSAWLNVLYSWGYAPRTQDQIHPANLHPNWFVHDNRQESILGFSVDELRRRGIEGYYLAPGNRQVRNYIFMVVDEILSKYDFDGIHLDYMRYPARTFTHDVALRSNFMRKYCVDPDDFSLSNFKQRLGQWGIADLDDLWREFVRDDLTSFVEELRMRIKSEKPRTLLSVAVKADYMTARTDFYQDWPRWINSNLVDFVCLMAYQKNIEGVLNRTLGVVNDPGKVAVGLGIYRLSSDQIKTQVRQVANRPFAGVVFFSYEELRKNRAFLNAFY